MPACPLAGGQPVGDVEGDADPTAVLRFDDGRWVCVAANGAWQALWGGRCPSVEGEPIGALLPDRFVAEGLGRLCDLATLTSTVRRAPVPPLAGTPRLAIAVRVAPAPDSLAPQVRLLLAPGSPSTLEAMHEALERGAPELVAVFDRDLRVIDVNDDVTAVSGLDRQQILGRTNMEMGYPAVVAELWDDHHRRVFATRRPHHVSYDLPTVLGPRHYESDISPVVDPSGAVVAVTVRSKDVTGVRLESARRRLGTAVGAPGALSAMWEHFEPTPRTAAEARHAVMRWLKDAGLVQFADAVELAVSELVTNAAMHARTDIYVQLEHVGGAIRVEVHDGSPAMPTVRSATTHGGRGLAVVELVADRWGADPTSAGKVVWCEFEHGPPVQLPVPSPSTLIERWADELP